MFTIAVFQDVTWADRGIGALLEDGFDETSLSVLARETEQAAALLAARFGAPAMRFDVPRLGPLLARGTLIATLQGADGGLAAAGLSAACRRAGFQPHDGHIYETLVGRGGVLVAVDDLARVSDALAKLHSYGGGNAAIGAWVGRV
jgi:hypothetical protein